MSREYYAYRQGASVPSLDSEQARRLLVAACVELDTGGWFQRGLGKDCVDSPLDVGAVVLERFGHETWPIWKEMPDLEEVWLYSFLEFLHDQVGKPVTTSYHDWNDCGVHVTTSDAEAGRTEFRERVSLILARLESPMEFRSNGEIWRGSPDGLDDLEPDPLGDELADDKVRSAIRSFRRHAASEDDKRNAVRDLADVLDQLRATQGTGLPRDEEARLFEIANNYGIRHHNPTQRTDYDRGIWLEWIFYTYLNAISLASGVIGRESAC